jgi:hypothetical protein
MIRADAELPRISRGRACIRNMVGPACPEGWAACRQRCSRHSVAWPSCIGPDEWHSDLPPHTSPQNDFGLRQPARAVGEQRVRWRAFQDHRTGISRPRRGRRERCGNCGRLLSGGSRCQSHRLETIGAARVVFRIGAAPIVSAVNCGRSSRTSSVQPAVRLD